METTSDTTVGPDGSAAWVRLLRAALILLIAVCVLVTAYVQILIPPVIVFAVLFAICLYLLTRTGKARTTGIVIGGIASLLFLLGNLPIVLADLEHPDSFLPFVSSGMGVVGAILGFVAMLGALFKAGGGAVRVLLGLGAAAVVVFAAVGLVSTLGAESDEQEADDVVLVAKAVDFYPEGDEPDDRGDEVEITVEAGGAVYVDNKDLFAHTFTSEEIGVDVHLPAGKGRRVVVDAEPGEYEFLCTIEGHEEDMAGTLVVE